jgi:biopolymer transport protein ExbD
VKAQLSLPDRPSALYLLAVLDILVLLLIFFALTPIVAQQAGLPVERLKTSSRLPSIHPNKKVILSARPARSGPRVLYRLGSIPIVFEKIEEEIARLKEEKGIEVVVAVLDERLNLNVLFDLEEAIRDTGIDVYFGGRFPVEEAGIRKLEEPPAKPGE